MSNKKLAILAILAAVMLAWAITQSRLAQKQTEQFQTDTPLIQGLDPDKVAAITIGAGEKALTLNRANDGFILADKDNYPALNDNINKLITSCLDITTAQHITANPDNHADLEVTEEKAQNVIKFNDDQGQLITGLIIGKRAEGTRGTYVRRLPGNDVFLSVNTPWLKTAATDYFDQQLLSVSRNDIAKVSVAAPNEQYIIARNSDGQIILQDIPSDKQAKGTDYEQVFNALASLSISDVQKDNNSDLKFDRVLACRLNNSTVYTLQLAQKDSKTYVKIAAEFTDKSLPTKQDIQQADEEKLKETDEKFQAKDAAVAFNQKHLGWIYELASWQASNLTKKFADLIEDKPKPEPPAETESAPAASLETPKAESTTSTPQITPAPAAQP